jgi:hypothetical protein
MTLSEWTSVVSSELRSAGFEVSEYRGFPLVKPGESHLEKYRLLKFSTSLPADRRIYAEGMLFVPAGSWREADKK